MSADHKFIRDEFVVAFLKRRNAGWERRWQLISERDAKGRSVNEKFGIFEPDGTVSAYRRASTADYLSRFEEIESDFQPKYEAIAFDEEAASRADGMRIWEYLLLEETQNMSLYFEAASSGRYVHWLGVKAEDQFEKYKGHSHSELRRLAAIKRSHFKFAASRCRKVLTIRPWDFIAQAAIRKFGVDFYRQMLTYIDSLRAS